MRYFQSTISQIACVAGSSHTLTLDDSKTIDTAFRKLVRQIVGHPSDWDYSRPYHELLHATNIRVSNFIVTSNINTWSIEIRKRQWAFVGSILRSDNCKWCFKLFHWRPAGSRTRGRPYLRFQDQFDKYWHHMHEIAEPLGITLANHWTDAIHNEQHWQKYLASFIEYHSIH